jgi:hypothetical protein
MSGKTLAAGSILFLLTACASTKQQGTKIAMNDTAAAVPAGDPKPTGKTICVSEMPSGSHIPERVCRYQDDADAEREAAQQALRNAETSKSPRSGN